MDIKTIMKSGSMGYHATINAVRKRDKDTCQICGSGQTGKRRLDVHHMDEKEEGKDREFKENHNMKKMVTLCRKCHMNLPNVRRKMSEGKLLAVKNSYE